MNHFFLLKMTTIHDLYICSLAWPELARIPRLSCRRMTFRFDDSPILNSLKSHNFKFIFILIRESWSSCVNLMENSLWVDRRHIHGQKVKKFEIFNWCDKNWGFLCLINNSIRMRMTSNSPIWQSLWNCGEKDTELWFFSSNLNVPEIIWSEFQPNFIQFYLIFSSNFFDHAKGHFERDTHSLRLSFY